MDAHLKLVGTAGREGGSSRSQRRTQVEMNIASPGRGRRKLPKTSNGFRWRGSVLLEEEKTSATVTPPKHSKCSNRNQKKKDNAAGREMMKMLTGREKNEMM